MCRVHALSESFKRFNCFDSFKLCLRDNALSLSISFALSHVTTGLGLAPPAVSPPVSSQLGSAFRNHTPSERMSAEYRERERELGYSLFPAFHRTLIEFLNYNYNKWVFARYTLRTQWIKSVHIPQAGTPERPTRTQNPIGNLCTIEKHVHVSVHVWGTTHALKQD